jgi:SEC-C motif-containing protein
MTLCPCGSSKQLDDCCAPILAGTPAPSALALLRSRYTAFVHGNIGYLAETLAPDIRDEFDLVEAERIVGAAKWQGLEIRAVTGGGEDDDTASIEFMARFSLQGQQRVQHERATFGRQDGRWVCTGGEVNPKEPPRHVDKVGRNDPCPCGSGKKYKKCCGA